MAPRDPRPRSLLFALDDTLTDRAASVRRYAGLFMRDFGGRFRFRDPRFVSAEIVRIDGQGLNYERAFDLAAHSGWLSSPGAEALEDHWDRHIADCTVARDGLRQTLRSLREAGVRLGVVTNGADAQQRAKLAQLELDTALDCIVTSEEAGASKPDARIFEAALDALSLSPGQCAFVGDHPERDVAGARALGMRAIWFRTGLRWPDNLEPPAEAITSLPELPRTILSAAPPAAR